MQQPKMPCSFCDQPSVFTKNLPVHVTVLEEALVSNNEGQRLNRRAGAQMDAQIHRSLRINVDIPVIITTVLDSLEAAIVDLSERGAQIAGCSLSVGTSVQIEYMGQTIYAQCRWAEVDRMGINFPYPLTDGPLYERLLVARNSTLPGNVSTGGQMTFAPMQAHAGAREFGRRTY